MRRRSHILMVDDSRVDAELFQEALREHSLEVKLTWLPDVAQALSLLRGETPFESVPLPDLILLDINMPLTDGWELLRQVKQIPLLRRIPILVLSSSESEFDIQQAYSLNANCYLTKPMDWDEYSELVRSLSQFWLYTALLAPPAPSAVFAEVA